MTKAPARIGTRTFAYIKGTSSVFLATAFSNPRVIICNPMTIMTARTTRLDWVRRLKLPEMRQARPTKAKPSALRGDVSRECASTVNFP